MSGSALRELFLRWGPTLAYSYGARVRSSDNIRPDTPVAPYCSALLCHVSAFRCQVAAVCFHVSAICRFCSATSCHLAAASWKAFAACSHLVAAFRHCSQFKHCAASPSHAISLGCITCLLPFRTARAQRARLFCNRCNLRLRRTSAHQTQPGT